MNGLAVNKLNETVTIECYTECSDQISFYEI